jgi:hypothetical protein
MATPTCTVPERAGPITGEFLSAQVFGDRPSFSSCQMKALVAHRLTDHHGEKRFGRAASENLGIGCAVRAIVTTGACLPKRDEAVRT